MKVWQLWCITFSNILIWIKFLSPRCQFHALALPFPPRFWRSVSRAPLFPLPSPLPPQLSLHYNDSFSILLLLFLLSDTHSAANFCESLLSPAPLCVCPAPIGNNNGSGSVSRCEIMVTRAGCSHYLPILLCTSCSGFEICYLRNLDGFLFHLAFLELGLSRRIFSSVLLLGKCGDANSVFWRLKRSFGSGLIQFWTLSCHRFCPRIGSTATLFGEKFLLLSPLAVRTNDLGPALSSEIYRALFSPLEIYWKLLHILRNNLKCTYLPSLSRSAF